MLTRLFAGFIFIFSLVYCINILASESQEIKIAYLTQKQQVPAALSNLAPFIEDKGLQGALLGLKDNNTTGQFTQQNYFLEQVIVPIGGDVKQAFSQVLKQGIQLVIVNLPAQQLVELHQLNNNQALLFDVATRTDAFRKNQCLADVLHILPSRAMRADALAQYMLKKRWDR